MNTICFGFLVMFCSHGQGGVPPSGEYCQIAKPITFSGQDTRLTKEQIDRHNRKWKALCRVKK